jgi:ring-1,2-phenylacetyl-CoA epoxidase subunit PaaC
LKEVTYHVRWCSEWVVRLGDGTAESKQRMNNALETLWPYTNELFKPSAYEFQAGIDMSILKEKYDARVKKVFDEATLALPSENVHSLFNGKEGKHTTHLKHILDEMQLLQRMYSGVEW